MERLSIKEIIEHCKRKRATFEKVKMAVMLETEDISNTFIKEYWEHRQVAEYLLELQMYRSIGTVEECRVAVEKQRAKKPTPIDYKKYMGVVNNTEYLRGAYWCPNCNHAIRSGDYCNDCGQAIDWSDTP